MCIKVIKYNSYWWPLSKCLILPPRRITKHRGLLGCNKGSRVHRPAILSDFSLCASGRSDIAHLDGTEGKLSEESLLIASKVPDNGLINARRAPQRLIASDNTLASSQILEIVIVEFFRGFKIQVLQFEVVSTRWTLFSKVTAEFSVGVGVVQEEPDNLASDFANCVSTWECHKWENQAWKV